MGEADSFVGWVNTLLSSQNINSLYLLSSYIVGATGHVYRIVLCIILTDALKQSAGNKFKNEL